MPRTLNMFAILSLGLTACSDESVFKSSDGNDDNPPQPATFTVGGTVVGLAASGLVLQNNGADDLAVSGPGPFTFDTRLASGSTYDVRIEKQPDTGVAQRCTVANGRGVVADATVNSVQVTCEMQVAKFLYVADSGSDDISAYTIDAGTGTLNAVVGSPYAADHAPAFVGADPLGRALFASNRGASTEPPRLSAYSIDATTGALTPAPDSPFHMSTPPPPPGEVVIGEPLVHRSGVLVYVGALSGVLFGLSADSQGNLIDIAGMPIRVGASLGRGVFNANGSVLYLPHDNLNGLAAGAISAYSVNTPAGVLTSIDSYPTGGRLPTMATLSNAGNFLLVPNSNTGNARGSVAVFAVDTASGTLTAIAGSPFTTGVGTMPTAVTVHPGKDFVYATNTNPPGQFSTITAFRMDPTTGFLTMTLGSPFPTQGTGATQGRIDPTGRFFYVANADSNTIQALAIDEVSGALSPVPGTPFPTERTPTGVAIDPSGRYLYCANGGSNSVSAYEISGNTGALRLINTVPSGAVPQVVELVGLQ